MRHAGQAVNKLVSNGIDKKCAFAMEAEWNNSKSTERTGNVYENKGQ